MNRDTLAMTGSSDVGSIYLTDLENGWEGMLLVAGSGSLNSLIVITGGDAAQDQQVSTLSTGTRVSSRQATTPTLVHYQPCPDAVCNAAAAPRFHSAGEDHGRRLRVPHVARVGHLEHHQGEDGHPVPVHPRGPRVFRDHAPYAVAVGVKEINALGGQVYYPCGDVVVSGVGGLLTCGVLPGATTSYYLVANGNYVRPSGGTVSVDLCRAYLTAMVGPYGVSGIGPFPVFC